MYVYLYTCFGAMLLYSAALHNYLHCLGLLPVDEYRLACVV